MRLSLDKTAELLRSGGVVAVPTETVYGLAASLDHVEAISNIFRYKGRPQDNPLIVHIGSKQDAIPLISKKPEGFDALADAFWPGPLTLIVPVNKNAVPEIARAGLATAGFRVPAHPLTLQLLALTGPLVMPSANISGKPSATSVSHVETDFGTDFPVLDGGQCPHGLESTILYWEGSKWVLVRLGAIPPERFVEVLGYMPEDRLKAGNAPLSPGQKYRHYAPKAVLHLVDTFDDEDQGVVLGFNGRSYPAQCKLYLLGDISKPEVAASLYAVLRQLDDDGVVEASVDFNLPESGLWKTIKERIKKAAHSS